MNLQELVSILKTLSSELSDGIESMSSKLSTSSLKFLDPLPRAILSFGTGVLVFFMLPDFSLSLRFLSAWNAQILCFLAIVMLMMGLTSREETRNRAQKKEADHRVVFLLAVCMACASLFAVTVVLAHNKDSFNIEVAMSMLAVLCSWLFMHTMFTLYYASLYYHKVGSNPEEYIGGLEFTTSDPPNYLNFIYFTFTFGMTFQTSDVTLASPTMRRMAIAHALVSFFFFTFIIALMVSIAYGLL